MTTELYEKLEVLAHLVRPGDLIQDMRSWSHVDSVTPWGSRVAIVHRVQATPHKNDVVQVLRLAPADWKQHSIMLNDACFRLGRALGEIPADATEAFIDAEEIVNLAVNTICVTQGEQQ